MKRPRILALVQAGGQGSRLDVLTRETPKPALPFAGGFRLVDFPLSNLRNSGIDDVWLSVQFRAQDLADAVGNGKPWDLDRHHGGFRLVVPQQGAGSAADDGFVSGNAEELLQNRDAIRTFAPDALVVMSADHVYRLDYTDVVAGHLERGAECTVVTTEVGIADASNHATVTAGPDGRVTGFAYKPEEPTTGVVATEVFVYHPEVLVAELERLHRELSQEASAAGKESEGSPLGDFGEHLLPALVARGRTFTHPLAGYWRDLGRPETYVAAHRELLTSDVDLFEPGWPILTNSSRHLPARVHAGGSVADSLLSPGCQVQGEVRTSVLGPDVVVGPGAVVVDSILFAGVRVEAGARVEWTVVDRDCVVGAGSQVGGPSAAEGVDPDHLVMIGLDSVVGPEVRLEPGARLEPGTTV
jgi:glucose-1-phosphate adenylyltransferase